MMQSTQKIVNTMFIFYDYRGYPAMSQYMQVGVWTKNMIIMIAGREYDKKTGCPSLIFLPCKASFAADLGWEPDLLPTPEELVSHK